MIKINKITTKTGDNGKTYGKFGHFVEKSSNEIEFLGKLDELNCSIGKALLYIKTIATKKILEKIQHQLFDIGAMFYKNQDEQCNDLIEFLEKNIKKLNQNLKELQSFLLPKGSELIIALNESRCIARNAERVFWKQYKQSDSTLIGIYLNRLSDLLFIIIRKNNTQIWIPICKKNYNLSIFCITSVILQLI